LILFIIGIPIIIPLALLASGPALIVNLIWNHFYPETITKKIFIVFISLIIGLILNPIIWIGGLVYLIPKGIHSLI